MEYHKRTHILDRLTRLASKKVNESNDEKFIISCKELLTYILSHTDNGDRRFKLDKIKTIAYYIINEEK